MRLCFIIEEEYRSDEMPLHVAELLAAWGHDVRLLHPEASATCLSALARVGHDRFDAYVLKTVSDGPGICILEAAAASGIATINNPRAIRLVRDKAAAAARARAAEIPFPLTYFVVDVRHVELIPRAYYPLVIKPSNGSSMRGVHRVARPAELHGLTFDAGRHRFLLAQRYVENEGYDVKLYCIGSEVFAVSRASPLHPGFTLPEAQIEVTPELARIARQVRSVFRLDIFGVDVVRASHGWVAVDINDFPGFRGVPGAVARISRHISRLARRAVVRHALGFERGMLHHRIGASLAGRSLAARRLPSTKVPAPPSTVRRNE